MTASEIAIRDTASNTSAVVLIHGFSGDAHTTYGMMPAFIAGDVTLTNWDIYCFGYPTSLSPDITGVWASDPDLTELAAYFRQFIDTRLARYSKVSIIAHSMGGLIAQRAIIDGVQKRLANLMLFGTPSGGLKKAGFGKLFKRQVRDMGAESDFLKGLSSDRASLFEDPQFTFDAVAGLSDQFVPSDSSLSPFHEKHQRRVPGNHLEIVKPLQANDPSISLVLDRLRGSSVSLPAPSAELPRGSVVELALSLELLGRQEEAILLLKQSAPSNTDIAGALAGRYKRRWLADPEGRHAEGQQAVDIYSDAFRKAAQAGDHKQAYYNGINAAFMTLALNNQRDVARELAGKVRTHTALASDSKWCDATEAEALLHLGEPDKAVGLYRRALKGLDPRERASMCQQAIWTARLLDLPLVEAQIEALMLVGAI